MPSNENSISKRFTDCLRLLAVDSIEKAKSGHPGMPLGAADIVYVLWQKYLKFNPKDTSWLNRDRFILSAGHGSMLLYALLHLYGYDITLDDIKNFRQLGSKTPGHPEFGITPGVETSTGPLGQGIANAVGMALGYEILKSKLTGARAAVHGAKTGYSPLNHKIYVLCGDGDIMEGISSEAISVAGHLKLSNLVLIYDDNSNTIEGSTSLTFSEDVELKFKAMGWDVVKIDGHNHAEIDSALAKASKNNEKPFLIIAKTIIAKGSVSFEGSHKSHGAPLGSEEQAKIKKKMCLDESRCFLVEDDISAHSKARVKELESIYSNWNSEFEAFLNNNPGCKAEYETLLKIKKIDLDDLLKIDFGSAKMATRVASGKIMQELAKADPGFLGGSADLGPSTNTILNEFKPFSMHDRAGRNLHFGIREHSMGAICNGLAIYSNFTPYASTFLIFSDYMKPAIRMAALMKLHVVYVLTHDSFYVGEDGPTHQPIEQVMNLRSIPGLDVIRPCDARETAVAWAQAFNNKDNPTALILTRQNVPQVDRTKYASPKGLLKGAYVISPEKGSNGLDLIIIATGSEVQLALETQHLLEDTGKSVRVVSMPSVELFEKQSREYRESLLPKSLRNRVVIEAGKTDAWYKYAGLDGLVIGIDKFGNSAPGEVLAEKYGFTSKYIFKKIQDYLLTR